MDRVENDAIFLDPRSAALIKLGGGALGGH